MFSLNEIEPIFLLKYTSFFFVILALQRSISIQIVIEHQNFCPLPERKTAGPTHTDWAKRTAGEILGRHFSVAVKILSESQHDYQDLVKDRLTWQIRDNKIGLGTSNAII